MLVCPTPIRHTLASAHPVDDVDTGAEGAHELAPSIRRRLGMRKQTRKMRLHALGKRRCGVARLSAILDRLVKAEAEEVARLHAVLQSQNPACITPQCVCRKEGTDQAALTRKQRMRQRVGCTDAECALEKVAPVHVLEATMAEGGAAMTVKQVQARLHEQGYCVPYVDVETAHDRWRRREKARAKRQAAAAHVVEPGSPGAKRQAAVAHGVEPDDGAHISLDALLAATGAAVSSECPTFKLPKRCSLSQS